MMHILQYTANVTVFAKLANKKVVYDNMEL